MSKIVASILWIPLLIKNAVVSFLEEKVTHLSLLRGKSFSFLLSTVFDMAFAACYPQIILADAGISRVNMKTSW